MEELSFPWGKDTGAQEAPTVQTCRFGELKTLNCENEFVCLCVIALLAIT